LVWLFILKDPGFRLTRWRLKLEEYQYTIQYKPGSSNTNADCLSRIHRVVTRSQQTTESTEHTQESENHETPPENSQTTSETPSELSVQSEHSDSQETNEYQSFLLADPNLKKTTPNISELQENLFDEELQASLVICVLADFKMTQGIELKMGRKFGYTAQLRRPNKALTEVASLETENISIFYLITKEHYWQKPTYQNIFQSLINLKKACEE